MMGSRAELDLFWDHHATRPEAWRSIGVDRNSIPYAVYGDDAGVFEKSKVGRNDSQPNRAGGRRWVSVTLVGRAPPTALTGSKNANLNISTAARPCFCGSIRSIKVQILMWHSCLCERETIQRSMLLTVIPMEIVSSVVTLDEAYEVSAADGLGFMGLGFMGFD